MKLIRLKITDPAGFRSLPCAFEQHFRTEWSWHNERKNGASFAPFVCAGPNGSGKSNLLEALAAVFYQLEVQRVRRGFLPEVLDEAKNLGTPQGFELEYLIHPTNKATEYAQVRVVKEPGSSPRLYWDNAAAFVADFSELAEDVSEDGECGEKQRDFLLPEFVLGYSSGENEVLSLPFFKMRFVAFDEYWTALRDRQAYPGHPDSRMAYLDSGFSQAILLCNLLCAEAPQWQALADGTGIESLTQFRIILRRSLPLDKTQADPFIPPITGASTDRPRVTFDADSEHYRLDVLHLLRESNIEKVKESSLAFDALRRCATLEFVDEASDSLVLDYRVDTATCDAFQANFDGAHALFQAFRILLTLNLYSVSDTLKVELYGSNSDYMRETVHTLASDERVMRFKHVTFRKQGVDKPISLKSLSDGEHQLLHSLGLCLLFAGTRSLFLLDEPETHFNPAWRASFITRLSRCLGENSNAEMLLTTHSPFPISDSTPDKVLLFDRDEASGQVHVTHPDYNTLGASINKITMLSFGKRETVGGRAERVMNDIRERFQNGEAADSLIDTLERTLGDSVEKVLLVNAMLSGEKRKGGEPA